MSSMPMTTCRIARVSLTTMRTATTYHSVCCRSSCVFMRICLHIATAWNNCDLLTRLIAVKIMASSCITSPDFILCLAHIVPFLLKHARTELCEPSRTPRRLCAPSKLQVSATLSLLPKVAAPLQTWPWQLSLVQALPIFPSSPLPFSPNLHVVSRQRRLPWPSPRKPCRTASGGQCRDRVHRTF
jgi:hypothetical protein